MSYLKEIKSHELGILKYIADICEKNNIRYYLAYGTLLGAVRHKGFIPWDDDIDIVMPRDDYNELKRILKVKNNTPYELLSWEHDKNYPYVFPKVIDERTRLKEYYFRHLDFNYGVYMDIFVMDGLPKSNFKKVVLENYYHLLYRLIRFYYKNYNDIRKSFKIIHPIFKRLIKIDQIKKRLDQIYLKYKFDDSELCRIQLGLSAKDYLKTKFFREEIKLEFEGYMFNGPIDWHEFLVSVYGENYMTPPPIYERKSNHNFMDIEIEGIRYLNNSN